ncbi:NAD-dependent succinate-semialdehyde dehydrogenase [Bordetella bronchiseptica]|uniref:Succinate-semialdehyde dehydrogenase [NADP+] n=2 Tax=Bordetella bronchiseptica TaxID=518 RepID=A0A0C6P190_BORBO|nr:NAD-dependent succinate-semialdehyde dehydrogenase [Bordetella bronchiseptica]AWP75576.1 NAD-dependent succinate-semialdehyde dehydrogenase [Bordetella bronchiseptica]AZW13095.1 NAD-dependent succinate-semialdehyde dehydrogenase [Bordetella bronchiseptica]AZW22349.1 NAD-dependent succinate-semialdehyde dehydrogenase [Bordetella bronchiseptica]QBS69680.1 NAD-dependent succinate-semialdehyde dehydrogenase [Bordetella bronchiseptica]RFT71235.1 NAD-dependent succinate-semialdehyde dehydrogenase
MPGRGCVPRFFSSDSIDMTISPLQLLNDPSLLRTDALVDGRWIAASRRFAVHDPATGRKLADVANLDAAHAREAIAAAQAAWPAWRARTVKERSAILRKWFDLLLANQDDLARLLTAEQGKPFGEARGEIAYAASFVEWFAEEAKRINGETLPAFDNNRRLLVLREPIGVCAAITPWNFPLAMITRKVAPALAAGCPVIVKPAEHTPLTALAAAQLAVRAGVPAGVLGVLPADGANSIAIGKELCANDAVRHLSFTGSTEVGRILMAQSAATVKKLSLELGGNAPFIVFDDADLDSAVEGAMQSKYRNAGQTCVCANRIYVQDGVYDAFVEKLADAVRALKVGPGFDEGVTQGPLIEPEAVDKIERHIEDAVSKGGRVVAGGRRLGGLFFEPTVLVDASSQMLCAREETFGPLAPVFRFHADEDAIAAANATEFGLASYLYSRDVGRIFRAAEALESGMVGVNVGMLATEHVPFGGVKQSGLGREGGRHGIDDYVEIKYMCVGDILK